LGPFEFLTILEADLSRSRFYRVQGAGEGLV